MPRDQVGVVKVGTIRKWLEHKRRWDARFKQAKARVHKQRLRDMAVGYEVFGEGEVPPPSALAGQRKLGAKHFEKKKARGLGLSLWALWGSKHDQMTVQREQHAAKTPGMTTASPGQGQGARAFSDLEKQTRAVRDEDGVPTTSETSESRAWEGLVGEEEAAAESAGAVKPSHDNLDLRPAGPVADGDKGAEKGAADRETKGFLSPDNAHETGVTGKRVMIGGLATPFSLRKEPETASMITLGTPMDQSSVRVSTADSSSFAAPPSVHIVDHQEKTDLPEREKGTNRDYDAVTPGTPTPLLSPTSPGAKSDLESFITAEEEPISR
jgi:hypothetical protein